MHAPETHREGIEMAELSQVRQTLALLNSMVMCGEDHSEHSRAMVRQALATIDAAPPREAEVEALLGEICDGFCPFDGSVRTHHSVCRRLHALFGADAREAARAGNERDGDGE